MILTQEMILQQLKTYTPKQIRFLLGRQRLKFDYLEMSYYVYYVFLHQKDTVSFWSIYHKLYLNISYTAFMKNLQTLSGLVKAIFHSFNKKLSIKASRLLNIVDTTLINEKQEKGLDQKDWDKGRVTTRKNSKGEKYHVIGHKGLALLNRFGQIYYAELMNINFSDQNILKTCLANPTRYQGILLADRGLTNKAVRERFLTQKNNLFTYQPILSRLISPYRNKSKIQLTEKEWKIYKRRWNIETLFQCLKYAYSDNKLILDGKYSEKIKQAKFFTAVIVHNLSITKL